MDSDVSEEFPENVKETNKPRKRKKSCDKWKRVLAKNARYDATAKTPKVSCNHNQDFCEAASLSNADIICRSILI